ncbi:hypothetical protein PROVRUST_07451 [Providencia rustigianii DSM 4541]|uniref:Uncharacterized protein n=1 Tax=Providencia rustigianii DSM 4541 TaxID=500637 RepID=D1P5E6_9GAMM|nr:hypothetical protein PROVRUST_07451 [Providencia rustigianii DSM 4541]
MLAPLTRRNNVAYSNTEIILLQPKLSLASFLSLLWRTIIHFDDLNKHYYQLNENLFKE